MKIIQELKDIIKEMLRDYSLIYRTTNKECRRHLKQELNKTKSNLDLVEEMATELSTIKSIISDNQDPIHDNLFKMLKWDDEQCDRHHLIEVDAFLKRISKLIWKKTKKPLNKEVYIKLLANMDEVDADNLEQDYKNNYKGYLVLRSNIEIAEIINKLLIEISDAISKGEYVTGRHGTLDQEIEKLI